jgi:hypothetical protein
LALAAGSFRLPAVAAAEAVAFAVAAFGLGLGFVHFHGPALQFFTVQGFDTGFGLCLLGHFDKTKTSRFIGELVFDDGR